MDKIVYGSKMKKVDSYTIDILGIPSMVLMERAALSIFMDIEESIDKSKNFLCLCGMGNNGADGIALARMLKLAGYEAEVITVGNEEKATKEWLNQKQIAICCDVVVENIDNFFVTADKNVSYNNIRAKLKLYDYVIDAIFGIGLTRNVEGVYKELIKAVNEERLSRLRCNIQLKVYAVDVPSGLCADTGKIMGIAMCADKTFTFGAMKTGLILCDGKDIAGETVVCDIGFPEKAYENGLDKTEICRMITKDDMERLSNRKRHSNKGTYGKVTVIAGSENMYGAAYFTARAACELGVGLVKIITHENNRDLIYEKLPEAMISTYKNGMSEDDIENLTEDAVSFSNTVVIGPGLSKSREAKLLVEHTMKQAYLQKKYIIIDADGLNIIADNSELKKYYHEKTVLTPHVGEAARLMGKSTSEIAENIIAIASEYAMKNRINIVQKDSATVILGIESCDNKCNNRVCINTSGNPGMATGGSGDVLAGMVAAVLAGGVNIKKSIEEEIGKNNQNDVKKCDVEVIKEIQEDKDVCQTETLSAQNENEITFIGASMAVYMHGLAGDMAARQIGETSMTATDILNMIHVVINQH